MKYDRGDILFNGIEGRYTLISEADFPEETYRITEFETRLFDVFVGTREVNFRAFEEASKSDDWTAVEGVDFEREVASGEMLAELRFGRWLDMGESEGMSDEFWPVVDTTSKDHAVYDIAEVGGESSSLAEGLVRMNELGNGARIKDDTVESGEHVERALRCGIWMPIEFINKYHYEDGPSQQHGEGTEQGKGSRKASSAIHTP